MSDKKSCNQICQIMHNAGVPCDIKWRSLINFLRTIEDNKRFTIEQKKELQTLLQNIIKDKLYSDADFEKIAKRIDEIQGNNINLIKWYTKEFEELKEKYKILKNAMQEILITFAESTDAGLTQSQENYNYLTDMKNIAVSSFIQNMDKSLIIANIIKSTENIIDKINTEIINWNLKNDEVNKWKQKAMEMEQLATIDDLTKLNNRRSFDLELKKQVELSLIQKTPLSMIMIDIDDFKLINDTYGHTTGDEALKLIASIIKKSVIDGFIARYGGEEFVVLCNKNIDTALKFAENIRLNVQNYKFKLRNTTINNCCIKLSISIGISEFLGCKILSNSNNISENELINYSILFLESTDAALYLAKKKGKNNVTVAKDCI